MNDNIQSQAIKIVIGVMMYLVGHYLPPEVGSTLVQYVPAMAAGVVAAGFFFYGLYLHYGQKLVPQKSTAVILPSGPEPKGTTIDLTPMTGLAKVVG